MKKIIILSYFFPPSVFVGGQRTEFWAKELHRFGYYPVIVTRNWNEGQTTLTEELETNEITVEKYETYEIHRLPYQRNLRDKLAEKKYMALLQKALTLWELIASNFSINVLPYRNMFSYTNNLLQQNDYHAIIASGRPFQTFRMGHLLKKKYDVLWIPDYRDEWNSHYRDLKRNPIQQFLKILEKRSEKKWVSNADKIISVSEQWVQRITSFTGVEGKTISNGYNAIVPKSQRNDKELHILYAGTLYPYQDIHPITEAVDTLNDENIVFYFVGTCESEEIERYLKELAKKKPQNFKWIDKLPKEQFDQLISSMDIGVITPYKNLTGCLPVKIFDYYSHELELLLCPSDHDLMEEFISETKSGVILSSKQECIDYLRVKSAAKQSGKYSVERDFKLGESYSRLYQTEQLAKLLDSLSTKKVV